MKKKFGIVIGLFFLFTFGGIANALSGPPAGSMLNGGIDSTALLDCIVWEFHPGSNSWTHATGSSGVGYTYAANGPVPAAIELVYTAYDPRQIGVGFSRSGDLRASGSEWDFPSLADVSDRTPIPEPATMLLFGSSLAGITGMIRRKLKKNS